MMLALALGFLVLLGVLYVFSSARQSYRYNEALARMQENGRIAFTVIEEDLKRAAYTGCQAPDRSGGMPTLNGFYKQVDAEVGPGEQPKLEELVGQEVRKNLRDGLYIEVKNAGSDKPDSFSIGYVSGAAQLVENTEESGSIPNKLELSDNVLAKGGVGMITDCVSIDFFKVGSTSAGAGDEFQVTLAQPLEKHYLQGAVAMPMPSWVTYKMDGSYTPGTDQPPASLVRGDETVIGNVADIYVEYGMIKGMSRDQLDDGAVDMATETDSEGKEVTVRNARPYLPAAEINPLPNPAMSRIGTLNIQLLLVSDEKNLYSGAARTIQFAGRDYSIPQNDTRLYEVFSTTIALRNRLN